MALLPRVFTFSKAPIIFLIGDRHACMSKNQSCRPLKKPFRTTGYFRHWQMRVYSGATKKGEHIRCGASTSSALRSSAFATDRASAEVNSNAR
jgi:hypothetical protein